MTRMHTLSIDGHSLRLDDLAAFLSGNVRVAATPAALDTPLPSPAAFVDGTLRLGVGDRLDRELLLDAFERGGYERVETVVAVGQWSVRGGIVDVFSPMHASPARLEFFGDDVESIRLFDPTTQRSTGPLDELLVLPLTVFSLSGCVSTDVLEEPAKDQEKEKEKPPEVKTIGDITTFAGTEPTTVGGVGHTIPYLIPNFRIATAIAIAVVLVELWAIAYIRARYMDTPFLRAAFQIVVGGLLLLPLAGPVGMAQAVCAMRIGVALALLAMAHRMAGPRRAAPLPAGEGPWASMGR